MTSSISTYTYTAHIDTYVVILFMALSLSVVSHLDSNFVTAYTFKVLAFSEPNLYCYMTTK
jgi:hypothetical protein